MKVEYQIDFIDALVVIDPTVFNEMDDEFLYAFDIYLMDTLNEESGFQRKVERST